MNKVYFIILAIALQELHLANAAESNLITSTKGKIGELTYDARIPYLDEVIAEQEKILTKLYRLRGNSYYGLKNYEAAELDFRKALPDSKRGSLEYGIGKCLIKQVKYHEALEMFRLADKKQTTETTRHEAYQYRYHIAYCLSEIKKYDEAIALFDQLAKDYPEEDMSAISSYIDAYKNQQKETVKPDIKNESKKELSPTQPKILTNAIPMATAIPPALDID